METHVLEGLNPASFCSPLAEQNGGPLLGIDFCVCSMSASSSWAQSSQLLAPGHVSAEACSTGASSTYGPLCTHRCTLQGSQQHAALYAQARSWSWICAFPRCLNEERNMHINVCAYKYMHVYASMDAHAQMSLTPRDPQTPWSFQQLSRTSLEFPICSFSHGLALRGMHIYSSAPLPHLPGCFICFLACLAWCLQVLTYSLAHLH